MIETTYPDLGEFLQERQACQEAVEWADRYGQRWPEAWRECPRGDWMLWLAANLAVDRKLIVRAACGCARLALRHAPEGEVGPRRAIELAEAWCEGRATVQQVTEGCVTSAVYASGAVAHVAVAAVSAAYAVYADVIDDTAPTAAVGAAAAAGVAAGGGDVEEAYAQRLQECADVVREWIPWSTVRDAYHAAPPANHRGVSPFQGEW